MKNLKNIILPLVALLSAAVFIIAGCRVINQTTVVNFAPVYNHQSGPEITGLRVFHETDSISRLYIRYRPSSMRYLLKQGRTYLTADYNFSYKLFDAYESRVLRDSATYFIYDSLYYRERDFLVFTIPVFTPEAGRYVLQLRFTDQNAGITVTHPVHIRKEIPGGAQYFLPVDETDEVIFEDWISWKTRFRIISGDPEIKMLHVDHYMHDFEPANPPFSMEHMKVYELQPADQFTVPVEIGTTELIQFGREGFFHFKQDINSEAGLTLYRFHDDYPLLTLDHLQVSPLRYLTSNVEYRELISSDQPHEAVARFWTENAGHPDRAARLAQSYNERVEHANLLFTSYKEGWKTDRGMIYIVFGPPKTVFRRSQLETWIYGEPGKRVSLRFDFVETENRFTYNDFELIRKPDYKNPYFVAVDFWRR
jgi:GWxTD domain-containing protein